MTMIRSADGGVVLTVRAQPGAKKERIVGRHGEALKIAVQAPPDKGRANQALIALLAGALGLSRSAVAIRSGHGSRDKTFFLAGMTVEGLNERLKGILGEGEHEP